MRLQPRPSPRHPELMIYMDGRVYDSNQMKWVNLVYTHQYSPRGPIALWSRLGKTYQIDVLKMIYETYISKETIQSHWMVDFKRGKEIKPENLVKKKKYEKEEKVIRPSYEQTCWMNGNDDIYMW
jgi:hypothetical protein